MLFRRSSWIRRLVRELLKVTVGMIIALIIVFVVYLNDREDLQIWHLADLDEEFTVDSDVTDFKAYLALEDRLFDQLDELVYNNANADKLTSINRFKRGSLADPQRWSPNWNRSFVMPATASAPSVLLIHGMSDSPYSLRHMGETLHEKGAWVVGLRVPGHGTAPSGLIRVTWEDMAAAVRLAVIHLAEVNPGQPLHIVGYSNGAALAVNYALATLDEPELPRVSSLVLLSPEIGLPRVAALAIWQSRLSWILGLEKLAWNSILPEYDPYKYGSFAVNAGDVSYRITNEIQKRITELTANQLISAMPPVLAFSSVVDATVLAPALVENLFNRMPAGDHELVLFDINREAGIEPFLHWSPDVMLTVLHENPHPTFTLSLLTNKGDPNGPLEVWHWASIEDTKTIEKLNLHWPENVYSLTHVALPFSAEDPLYGGESTEVSPGIQLGNIAMHGERGVLKVSASDMLRLRWNPFYSYLEETALEFMGFDSEENPDSVNPDSVNPDSN